MSNRIRHGKFVRNRTVVMAAAVLGVAAAGAAGAGYTPWSTAARPRLSVEASGHASGGTGASSVVGAGAGSAKFGLDALTDRSHGGDAPAAASGALSGSVGSTNPPAADGAATLPPEESTTPPFTPNVSDNPAPGSAEPIDGPPVGSIDGQSDGKVIVSSQSRPGFEPIVTAAPTTTTPPPTTQHPKPVEPPATTAPPQPSEPSTTAEAPNPVEPATTSTVAKPAEPPATTAAPKPAEPATSEASTTTPPSTTNPSTTPPSTTPPSTTLAPTPHNDSVVPQTLGLSCVLSGDAAANTVSCSWSVSAALGFYRYLLLRGNGGGTGRVPFSSTDPSAGSFVDSGLAAGQYSYVVVELDQAGKTLVHSNPVSIVVQPVAG